MKHTLFLKKTPKLAWFRYCLAAMLGFALAHNAQAQNCTNASSFGSNVLPTTVGQTTNLTTCQFACEYSSSTTAQVIGYTYSAATNLAGGWVTVHTGTPAGPIVATGTPSASWTATTANNVYVHVNSPGCGCTSTGCLTTSVTLLSTAPPCSAAPNGGTAVATPAQTTYCGTASPTLSLTGASVGGGISYQWQSSPTGAVWTNVAGATAATYIVPGITTSTLYRCNVTCNNTIPITTTASTPILINVAPNPVVSATPNPAVICQGNSTVITGGGAASYSWAPGGATTSSITVSPAASTTYTVTGTLGSCTATGTATIQVGTPFTITPVTATPSSVCVGGSTVLSATTPGAIMTFCQPVYTNGTGSGDWAQSVVIPTTTLNNVSGASGSPYYTLFPQSGNTTCTLTAGSTYTIQVATGSWIANDVAAWIDYNGNGVLDNAGEKLGEVDNLAAFGTGSIIFTVPTTTFSGTHRLRIREADQGTLGGMEPCNVVSPTTFGETEDYNITINSSVQLATILWTESLPGTTLAANNTVPVNANNITANKTYSISVSKDGCTATGSVNVTANPLPTATMTTSTSTVCAGQSPSITITGTPNTNVVYSINGVNQPAVSTGGSGSVTFSPPAISANTAYALVSATTPATTCTATLAGGFTVSVNERPAGQMIGTPTVCKDNPAFIGFGSPSGGTVFPIYVTFTDGTNTFLDTAAGAGENFPVPSNVPGVFTYTLTALSSANGCDALPADMGGAAIVTVKDLPTATVTSADAGVCPGGNTDITLTFTGDAPFSFNYFNGVSSVGDVAATNTYTFNVMPTAPSGSYYVENLLDNNICIATPSGLADTATVVVYDTTTITSQPIAAITTCSETDATITMTAIGQNLTYTWYENGNPIVAGPNYVINNNILTINNVTGLDGYTYYVVVHSDCGNDQTSNTTTINEDHTNNWSGTVDSDWNDGMNWSCGSVPIVTTDVIIPVTAPNQPIVEIPNAVCHDLTLLGAASLTFVSNMQLSVHGDIMNTTGGTIDGTGAKLILNGTIQNAAGPMTLNDLDVNGGGVKTFTNDITVNGILNLVLGNIELGTANLTLAQPVAQLGGSASSFIVTNGTGRVTGNNMGAVGGNPDAVMFHVGINNTSYTPITLENLGDADNYSVRVMENVYEDGTGIIPTEVTNPVVDRTWLVEEGTAGGSIVNMSPYWNTVDEVNGFDQTHVFVAHYMGGMWTSTVDSADAAPAATPFGAMWTTTEDSIMSFSPFTVASSGQFPLAIRLGSITATNVGARNKVQWKSETEDMGDVYELESSADGRKFTKIATIAANGTPSTYVQWDETPVVGVNYYRVKLLNNDGTYSYSKVVSATVKGTEGFSIEAYPNPVKNVVGVKVNGVVSGKGTVVVTDVTGKVVKSATEVKDNGAEINVSDLASGVYLLNYTDDVRNESIKITKQ